MFSSYVPFVLYSYTASIPYIEERDPAWLGFSIISLHCRSSSLDKEGERTAKAAVSPEKKLKLETKDHGTADNATSTRHGAVTVLPGLAAYSSDSSEPED